MTLFIYNFTLLIGFVELKEDYELIPKELLRKKSESSANIKLAARRQFPWEKTVILGHFTNMQANYILFVQIRTNAKHVALSVSLSQFLFLRISFL